jgi:protoporphyrinogen IX oxidase
MEYQHVKSLHIIFMVSWFAGLFYFPRLLVYHTDAQQKDPEAMRVLSTEYQRIERLLLRAIMYPALILTLFFGFWMLHWVPAFWQEKWMQIKLLLVFCLLLYQIQCHRLMKQMAQGVFRWTSLQLRLWNEIPTILLFGVVFLVVLKNTVDWIWSVVGLLVFSVLIMSAVRLVKAFREKK